MKNYRDRAIVFITGEFLHHSCWDEWKKYFEKKGFRTNVAPWPFKDASAETLRNRHPDGQIASNRLGNLIEHYATVVKQFDESAILIGHSIGGLIVQLLLQRGLGSAGVAIHSVPPRGVITFKFSFLKAGWGPLGFFTSTRNSFLLSFKQWQYAFTNNMNWEEQTEAYYRYAIPESKLIVRDTITKAAKVNFEHIRAPLLLTSGSEDHTIPPALNYSNYLRYKDSKSITDYKEFKGRNHFVLGQATWKEDADYILNWIERQ